MGQEKSRRVWPHHADHVLTTRATSEQFIRWHQAARIDSMKPHMGVWLARAADFYTRYLERQMERALKREGR